MIGHLSLELPVSQVAVLTSTNRTLNDKCMLQIKPLDADYLEKKPISGCSCSRRHEMSGRNPNS